MRLLFDENLSFKLCERLGDLFPSSSHVRLVGLAEASDHAIWDFAGAHGLILVSLDADFAERAILNGPPPKVIWLRCGNQPVEAIEKLLRDHAEAIMAVERDMATCLELY